MANNNPSTVAANPDTVATSDTSKRMTDSSAKLKWSDKRFVTKVAEGAQLEIALADLAAQRASNAEVRAFAEKVSSQHVELSRKLAALAENKGLRNEVAEYAPHQGAIAMVSGGLPSSGESIVGTTPHYQPGTSNFDETQKRADSNAISRSTTANNDLSVAVAAPKNQPGTTNYDETQNQKAPVSSSATSHSLGSSDAIAANRTADYGVAGAPTGTMGSSMAASADWNDPTKDRHYTRLAAKSGAEFDQAFIAATLAAHEDAAEMFEKKSANAKDEDVRAFASNHLAGIQAGLTEAQRLSAQVKSEP